MTTDRRRRIVSAIREAAGLAALLATLAVAAVVAGAVFLAALLWLPDAARSTGLVETVSFGVVFVSGLIGLAASAAAILACLFVGPRCFEGALRLASAALDSRR